MVAGRETVLKGPSAAVAPSSNGLSSLSLLADLGGGLKLYTADLSTLREQDVNARIMPSSEFAQLVSNIKKRGHLESVPYCVLANGVVELVSGHNRVRAAREAGITHAPVLVDESGLSRSEVVAKQLAHNRIVGFDDRDTLNKLFTMIHDPDLVLETGLSGELMKTLDVELEPLLAPRMDMDWKNVTFTFLPHQLEALQELVDAMPPSDDVMTAAMGQFDSFMKATVGVGRLKNVRNAGMAVALLTEIALREIQSAEESEDGEEKDDE